MKLKLECLLLLLLVVSASAASRKGPGPIPGGWSPIKDINDPHVKEIADYAVTEYNKRSGAKLKLEKVIKGDTQVVAGTNYRLTLAATDGSTSNNYQALVWEKPWQHFRNLTSFNPVHA
ncbi:Cystatin domain [Sesbania bispinosa]|nr:Cystatin domain [Sesbania bispinosa]